MFPLHETTRRTVCRIAFLALCVVPTLVVLSWVAWAHSPGRVASDEQTLAERLEMEITIGRRSTPRPKVTLYQDVIVSDPDTRRVIVKLAWVEATELAEGVAITIPRADADAAELNRLWNIVGRLLRRQRAAGEPAVQVAIDHLTLHQGPLAVTLAHVSGRLAADEKASRANLQFMLPEATATPVELRIERSQAVDPPTTRVELTTGGGALPLAVVEAVFPAAKHFGSAAEFRGQLWASETASLWSGEVVGQLTKVDLDRLVTSQFPHKLSGSAGITLQMLAFRAGRLTQLAGRLDAGPGVVGRSLLAAAADELEMSVAEMAKSGERDPLPYRRLGLAFQLDGTQARLEGAVADADAKRPPGAVMIGEHGELLRQATHQPQAALAVIRALMPTGGVNVPVTTETDWLLQRLPIPTVMATAIEGRAPRGNLHDADTERK